MLHIYRVQVAVIGYILAHSLYAAKRTFDRVCDDLMRRFVTKKRFYCVLLNL